MSSTPYDNRALHFTTDPLPPRRPLIALIVRGNGYCDVFSAIPKDKHVARTLTFEAALAVRRLYDSEYNP